MAIRKPNKYIFEPKPFSQLAKFSQEKKKERKKRGGCRRSPRRLLAARPVPIRL
jgi:hypothetical protein